MSEIAKLEELEILDSRGNPALAIGSKAKYAGAGIYERWKHSVKA